MASAPRRVTDRHAGLVCDHMLAASCRATSAAAAMDRRDHEAVAASMKVDRVAWHGIQYLHEPAPAAARYHLTAIASISTLAPLGRAATATVDLAGLCAPKCAAYALFTFSKSPMFVRNMVVFATFSDVRPAALSTSSKF